ncbi:hypothetical protein FRC08_004428 [Ceratobasidium sp. 394]|nr:hypothetical protein FRC08_004428 [Ceratobasidium sp. 394]
MVYNAVFIAYLLLSSFPRIGEKERLAVELILDLAVSYNLDYSRIAMSRDVYGKARVFLPQLLYLAERHGFTKLSKEAEIGYIGAHALLLAIVRPLIDHLSPYEHKEVQNSLEEAYLLLDLALPNLRCAVEAWSIKNFEMTLQTTPLPRANLYDQLERHQTRSLPRIKPHYVKRRDLNHVEFGLSQANSRSNVREESTGLNLIASQSFGQPFRPWWDRPTGGQGVGLGLGTMSAEELGSPAFSEYPSSKLGSPSFTEYPSSKAGSPPFSEYPSSKVRSSAFTEYLSSKASSSGPATPSALTNHEYWNDRMGYEKAAYGMPSWGPTQPWDGRAPGDVRDIPRVVGQKLKKGLRAMLDRL